MPPQDATPAVAPTPAVDDDPCDLPSSLPASKRSRVEPPAPPKVIPSEGLPEDVEIDPNFTSEVLHRLRCGSSLAVPERNHSNLQYQRKQVAFVSHLADEERSGLDLHLSILLHWSAKEGKYVPLVGQSKPQVRLFGEPDLKDRVEARMRTGSLIQLATDAASELTEELKALVRATALATGHMVDGEPVVDAQAVASTLLPAHVVSAEGGAKRRVAKMINMHPAE